MVESPAGAALIQGMSTMKRQPSGQPIGGQFAAGSRQESHVSLSQASTRTGPLELTFDQLQVGDEFIDHSAAAGDLRDHYLKVISSRQHIVGGNRYQRIDYETRDGRTGTGDFLVAYADSEKDERWPRKAPKATIYGKWVDAADRDYEPVQVPSAREVAEAAVDRLFAEDPAAAYQLYRGMLSKVRSAEYPRLRFEFRPDPDYPDEPEAVIPTFIDPYTGEETGIRIVDRAVRWTENDSIEPDPEEEMISVDYGGGDDGNGFETLVYTSTMTGKPVRLPEGWEER